MAIVPARFRRGIPVVPVVRLSGVIGAVTPLRPGLSLAGVARTLERAFADPHAKAVALVINSPGGSPVQSRLIYLRIRAARRGEEAAGAGLRRGRRGLRRLHDRLRRPTRSFAIRPRSSARSAWSAAPSVFTELIKKIGVERRLYTAGEHKAQLDPFLPEDPDDVARVKALQREIHAIFIALVKDSRGARLKGAEDELFSGEYWAGDTLGVARPCRRHRRSALDAARALRRQGADPGDRAADRDAGRAVRPHVAGGDVAARLARRRRRTAGSR